MTLLLGNETRSSGRSDSKGGLGTASLSRDTRLRILQW